MSPATTCCTRARATLPHTHTHAHTRRERLSLCLLFGSCLISCSQVQLHTTFHYPPTPPIEGEGGPVAEQQQQQQLAVEAAHDPAGKALPSSSQQQFHSLPTPPTPELAVATFQQLQNGAAELPVSSGACSPASYESSKQLYQWQSAGPNLCAVMGHPQFAPCGSSRRPPPLYYQTTGGGEKNTVAAAAATGPLRSPMSEFVVMKECIDGELSEG